MSRDRIIIRQPDDFHVHLRQDDMLGQVAAYTANMFGRALVMPNTLPPISDSPQAERYRAQIQEIVGGEFKALTTIKLTDKTSPENIHRCVRNGVRAAKLYPQGVTTNSEDGWADINVLWTAFEEMEKVGMVLCLHGETPGVFCMDREKDFLNTLDRIAVDFPELKIVLEHVTTADAVERVREHENVAATITVHHLLITLDDVVGDKLNPHNFCKPIAKTPIDRTLLVAAATGALPHSHKFFLGTDSAPHHVDTKHCDAGCAGVFSAPVAMPVLAELFETEGGVSWIDALERFASLNGAAFYGLDPNEGTITLKKKEWKVPQAYGNVVPFMAGQTLQWQVDYGDCE